MHLKNNLVMGSTVHRDYSSEYKKIGDKLTIRKPVRFKVSDGKTRVPQDVLESSTDITMDQQKHVSWSFSSKDLTLTIEDYAERYIKPAMISLANAVDVALHGLYPQIFNCVGIPGTIPTTIAQLEAATELLDICSVPEEDRCAVLDPRAYKRMLPDLRKLFIPRTIESVLRRGHMGDIDGLSVYRSQNVQTHTSGDYAGAVQVNGALTTGADTISLKTFTQAAPTVKAGDVFTVAASNRVNAVTYANQPELMQFVVEADKTGAANAIANVDIAPVVYDGSGATGVWQNVSAMPANNALVTFHGADNQDSLQNLVFHKNALALVIAPLEMPDEWGYTAQADGFAVRIVKQYDIDEDDEVIRCDVLFGVKAIYPELACRLTG